ncbi:MAG TPA: elongation factor G [candidate division Zixibacteria bacterium]|nr:elongation factor G [candidate division Zixibacteria bacterium]
MAAREKIRNIGLTGHGGSGKTSLAESFLFSAKVTSRLGRVEEGNTVSDYAADEIARKISISASLLHFDWKDCKFNVVDMPGYADFIGEVAGGLSISETALIVVNTASGLEVGVEQVLKYAERYRTAKIFFFNKLDKEHTDFNKTLEQFKSHYGGGVLPFFLPIGEGPGLKGVIDVLAKKAFTHEGGQTKEIPVPPSETAKMEEARQKILEAAAESDDALLEKFFDSGTLTEDELKGGLHHGIKEGKIMPVLAGSAANLIGVGPALDFLAAYAPSPADYTEVEGILPGTSQKIARKTLVSEPLSARIFKTVSEPHLGELSFFRVYSGKVAPGNDVFNAGRQASERIGQIYLMNGKERKEVNEVAAGDVGAFVKLKASHTGDTLCDKKAPIFFPSIEFPKPVINLAVVPKRKEDEEKMAVGFSRLHEEDPTFYMAYDNEIHQNIVHGQGELHLEVIIDRLKRKFGIEVELIKPRIPYRETIKAKAEVQGKHKKQSGGRGQYGDVWLRIEPLKRGEGFQFVDDVVGGVVPSKYIPSVEKGVIEAMHEGALAGYPVVDVRVTIYDGSYHTVDSSDIAFKIAGSLAFRTGFMQCRPVLLEPIYNVEVLVPGEYMGDVMGDLSARRGKISGMEADGGFEKIKAQVPLGDLYKYSTTLRSLTQGRGHHTRSFSHYEEVPRETAEKVIKESQAEKTNGK